MHDSELTDDYCKRYFLVGLLLREVLRYNLQMLWSTNVTAGFIDNPKSHGINLPKEFKRDFKNSNLEKFKQSWEVNSNLVVNHCYSFL